MDEKITTPGTRIRTLRKRLGMSQEELARKMGYSHKSSISRFEKDLAAGITYDQAQRFAKALETTVDFIWPDAGFNPGIANITEVTSKKIPIIGEVACGQPVYAEQQYDLFTAPMSGINADAALIARGESMKNADISDGDVVLIRLTPEVDNGQIAVVIIDDEATLKRFYYYPKQNLVVLRPENPDFQDLVYTGEELENIRIIGKAVAVQKPL